MVPAYLVTGGRAHPTRNTVERLTVLNTTTDTPPQGLPPEELRVVELLAPGPLTVTEVAAYLALPISVIKVVVSDLVDAGHLIARSPVPQAEHPDRLLLEKVISGLRALKS